MKRVILYCRVSSDEQKTNNSLPYQESRLRQFAELMKYEVVEVITDDKSGKNFNRPGWKKLRDICCKKQNHIDAVYFLRWDRFARNVAQSLMEIEKFDKYNVALNSFEQPLDLSKPDSILLLSIFLAVPEVERHKISIRTREGTYQAQKSGKCTNKAPKGYINIKIDDDTKTVVVDKTKAEIVKYAFNEAAKGVKSIEFIRREVNRKGLIIGKSAFPAMLKNRFYIGEVHVMKWEDNPSYWVKGLHTPIIDFETFNRIQEHHFGKRIKKTKLMRSSNDDFYLRRFLVCPHCGKGMAGCYSHGNGGEYPYYKCPNCNRFNANATKANNSFIKYVNTLKPRPEMLKLYSEVFAEINGEASKDVRKAVADAVLKKETEKQRIEKADIDYVDGKLERANYLRIVGGINERIKQIDDEIYRLTHIADKQIDVKFDFAVNLLSNLGKVLTTAPLEDKINVLGSMFPDKIEFDGKNYRTNSYNKVLDIIFQETSYLQGQKKEEADKKSAPSRPVPRAGIEPAWK